MSEVTAGEFFYPSGCERLVGTIASTCVHLPLLPILWNCVNAWSMSRKRQFYVYANKGFGTADAGMHLESVEK